LPALWERFRRRAAVLAPVREDTIARRENRYRRNPMPISSVLPLTILEPKNLPISSPLTVGKQRFMRNSAEIYWNEDKRIFVAAAA